MTTLVTGASGFVGYHVARALCERGERPRCLVRATSDVRRLAALGVELVTGDLTDLDSLRRAAAGCRIVYHVAADYRFWSPDPSERYRINVEGTRNLLDAAVAAERIVYTSTVGCLGLRRDGQPSDETTPARLEDMVGDYKRSKFLAEQLVLERARAGQPIVVVNPSTPVGEADARPTPTGKIIVDFLNGRLPAYVNTGLNLVDVADVAEGHLLACERGVVGERYILGCQNTSLHDMLQLLAALTGRRTPWLRVPVELGVVAGLVSTMVDGRLRRREPAVPLEAARMARHWMYFSAAKARRELGLPQRPVLDALARAVAWFERVGYVRRG